MCTSDMENRQHRNMLEHRRRQIANIDFVKNSKQHATTLKSASHRRRPHTLPTAMEVGDVDDRLEGGVGNFKRHRDGQVSDVTVVKRN